MRKYLFYCGSFLFTSPAIAQDAEPVEPPIVFADYRIDETTITVTATGTRTEVEDTGQPVTVIGREEIEAVQGHDVTRVLARAPGVTLARNGPPGAFTGV